MMHEECVKRNNKSVPTQTKAEKIDEILTIMMKLAGESPEFIQKMQSKWKAEREAQKA